ncbi:CDP-glycerol glycerophosphotransferase family protein [Liquorilactobacillus uvarum]|uniref:CDP-glycerol glycerophosphotransferase family protein n=1 Tax=Liquorilactobacillus uvarum TaxID=303240 RepID=UPI00288A088D|nr:CDP-glycerol glycerophosphotransferase family protein [Liquorilactobacillus uvarum]
MKKIIYIWLVRFFSFLFTSKKPKLVIYLMSFGNNNNFILKLSKKCASKKERLIVLYYPNCKRAASELNTAGVETVCFTEGLHFILVELRLVLNAKLLFCDNYYAFLAGCRFDHRKTKVVQVWHANGAVKSFGWQEPKTLMRSLADKKRFQEVYDQFDDYVVGSTKMAAIFVRSYHVKKDKMLILGYPRSDKFSHPEWVLQKRKLFYQRYPDLKDKEIILYAPTYREGNNGVYIDLPPSFFESTNHLDEKQVLIIKLHPHLGESGQAIRKRFAANKKVLWLDDLLTEEILPVTDRLITDYSSVIFDYSLLKNAKEILFYCYDLEEYQDKIGIQPDFEQWLPGSLLKTTKELFSALKQPLGQNDLSEFNKLWNTRNDGYAAERIIKHYLK